MEERHYLVGTAGHVDHGKTELIRALSGIETDRLKEEKQRGISIELGFAHMTLPSGRQVGIVDVPGHERFVRQMLAGASGMDIVLLVVAADEGIMPQTREHLDILTLLGIPKGIVILNKIDLVDQDWQELIVEEIKEELKNTAFQDAPICAVSAVTRQGIPDLQNKIDELLAVVESKKATGPVRMPLDRVFSIQGFGTVVTGTLHSGSIALGQELAIEPGHLLAKVRSLQVHGEKVSVAGAGQRVAVNLAGVDVSEVERGTVLVTPNVFKVGNILDLKVQNLPSMEKPLSQRQRVRFHLGTNEVLGRIHLLDQEEIAPGQAGYAQILLESELLAAPGDHFVLRQYSPAHTMAGGKILGVAQYKHKRFKESVLAQMCLKDQGDPLDLLEKELLEPQNITNLLTMFQLPASDIQALLSDLAGSGRIEIWAEEGQEIYWATMAASRWRSKLVGTVKAYQKAYPLRGGISREELKTKLGITWPHKRWQNILEQGAERSYYRITGSKVQINEGTELPDMIRKKLDALRRGWQGVGLTPPDLESAALACGINKAEAPEYAQYLCENGEWVQANGFYFTKDAFVSGKEKLLTYLKEHGEITVAQAREIWGTSRKYTVPLLEYFDQQRVTKRLGDKRVRF